ncbi:MAG: 4Fe-4S dicluster domain-containing protein [Candidatus Hodarchaeota archaeon]
MWTKTFLERSVDSWKLSRRMYVQIDELELIGNRCAKCDLCVESCPKEALSFEIGTTGERTQLVVDSEKCVFCGTCVAACVYHALALRTNNEDIIPVVEKKVFPLIVQEGQVQVLQEEAAKKCPTCHICVAQCPQEAISLKFVDGIPEIRVDYTKCAGCRSCEVNCPVNIITAQPAFEGTLEINMEQAQQVGIQLAEICPMECFGISDDGELTHDQTACTFCGACLHVPGAPEDMIIIKRTAMREVLGFSSGVIEEIHKKLLSPEATSAE